MQVLEHQGQLDLRFAYELLRAAWFGWLAALLVVFAYPVAVLEIPGIHDLVVILRGSAAMCERDDCAAESWLVSHEDWSLLGLTYDYAIWVPLVLAVVIPTLIHWRLRGRLGAVFERWPRCPGSNESLSYRTTGGYSLVANQRAFVTHIRQYVTRMSVAMLLRRHKRCQPLLGWARHVACATVGSRITREGLRWQ